MALYKSTYINPPLFTILYILPILLTLIPTASCHRRNDKHNFPAVIVFGDSTVDPGNNNFLSTAAKSNFPPYGRDLPDEKPTGRFCNGRLPTDFMSEKLGLKKMIPAYLDPSFSISDFATGVAFASAGTGFDNFTANAYSVLPLWKQVEYYKEYQKRLRDHLGDRKAQFIIQESLYAISIGTNDFIVNYYQFPQRPLEFPVEEYQVFLLKIAEDFFRELYSLGARKFSITGIYPMGTIPFERTVNILQGNAKLKKHNVDALNFNKKFEKLVKRLNRELPGMRSNIVNPYHLFMDMIKNPQSYGFEVVDRGCCATGELEIGILCNEKSPFTCTDADKFIFWDAVHPTQKTYQLVADVLVSEYLAQYP